MVQRCSSPEAVEDSNCKPEARKQIQSEVDSDSRVWRQEASVRDHNLIVLS